MYRHLGFIERHALALDGLSITAMTRAPRDAKSPTLAAHEAPPPAEPPRRAPGQARSMALIIESGHVFEGLGGLLAG
ncbi:hypothetical protein [Myxococcus stipitatus]|uniref:hypothetical protein n=1 Tax=Myxococcus stipitatus TaxID=83455 RepID=UPI0030CD1140